MKLKSALILFFIAFTQHSVVSQTYDVKKNLKDFDAYINKIMKEWNAPGVAVGVVAGDRLVFAKGYGYRDIDNKLPVTPETLFQIASNTKLFTAVAAGFLVEEGKLAWDEPIRNFDPSIRFHNDALNNTVTLRDMLAHRTGISRHDALWYKADFTRQELFEKIRYLEPSQPLRQGYLYNNLMYMGVGYVIEHIAGKPWEDYVREKIFGPLQMTNSMFEVETMEKKSDFAFPYYEKRDTTILLKRPFYREMGGVGPCGSIISNVQDMSHWLIALMNKGRYNGQQVIPESILSATLQPAVANPNTNLEVKGYGEIINPTYGMGRSMYSYKGHFFTGHGGAIGGFYSQVSTLLYDKIGVIVFVNGAHNYPMVDIITRNIYDRFLGMEQTPWHERALKDYLAAKKAGKESRTKAKTDQVKNTQPSHQLGDYAGEYENPAYGKVRIELKSNKLMFDFNHVVLPLEHFHYDRFDSPDDELDGKWSLNFYTSPLGEIDKLLISLDQSEVTFIRKADSKLSDPATLKLYTGVFSSPNGTPVEVKASEEKSLLLAFPGQPLYELIPYKPGQFKMKEFSDALIEFVSEGGKITGFRMRDPSGEAFYKSKE